MTNTPLPTRRSIPRPAVFALLTGAVALIAALPDVAGAKARKRRPTAPTTTTARSKPTSAATVSSQLIGGRWVTGYYVGYQQALYPPTEIDFSSITHITMGRVRPRPDGSLVTDFDIDAVAGPALAKQVSGLAHQNGRRAILMVGGAGERDNFIAASAAPLRAQFVASLLRAVDAYGYDGVDLDWEPIEDADQPALLALARDLKAARPSLLVTVPVLWTNPNWQTVSPWYAQLAATVDQMNVMTYGMSDAWSDWKSWHSGALTGEAPNTPSSVSATIGMYRKAGVPAAKLGFGLGFFGTCWKGVNGPRQEITGAAVIAGDNTMTYANITANYANPASRKWDLEAQVPYLSFDTPTGPQGCTYVSYEDERSIAAKGAFVKSQGLGGVIIWTIGQGHLTTAPAGARDPLLIATRNALR